MKRLMALLLMAGLAATATPEANHTTVSANGDSTTVTTAGPTVLIINDDDSDTVYVRVFATGETTGAADANDIPILPGEGLSFTKEIGVGAVSVYCANAASVRVIYW